MRVHLLLAVLQLAGLHRPSVVPLAEFMSTSQPDKYFFFNTQYEQVDGRIVLLQTPGLSIDLCEEKTENGRK